MSLPPIVVLFLLPVLFFKLSNLFFTRLAYAQYIYPVFALLFGLRLGEFQRIDFVKNTFNKNTFAKIRLLEHLLLAIPFILFLIYKQFFTEALLLFVLASIVSQFNNTMSFSFVLPTPFYKKPFEFIIGFRKTFFIFIGAYYLTYLSIDVHNFNLGIFSFLAVMLTTMSYYSQPEPIFYVWIHKQKPKEFLKEKITIATIFNLALVLPIIIALMLNFPISNFDLIVLFTILGILFIATNILGKYSSFPLKIQLNQSIFLGLCFMFPLLLFVTIPYLYKQAIKSLKNYL